MTNSNVQKLTAVNSRHTVRMMAASPHGGIVAERRADDFLVINVNELVDCVLTGCATMVFQGDLPTAAELRDCDLVVMGTWGWHKVFGSRFDVDAWGIVERERIASKPAEPVARKARRLDVVPEAPAKPVQIAKPVRAPKPDTRSQRRTAPTAEAIAQTNDWYAQTNGMGDSLDVL